MRAVDICLFMVAISVGISVVGAAVPALEQGPQGHSPGEINPRGNTDLNLPGLNVFVLGVGTLGGFIISALSARLMGADPLRVIGIGMFGGLFWGTWTSAQSILTWAEVPAYVSSTILMIYAITFFMAISEMSSGSSYSVMK